VAFFLGFFLQGIATGVFVSLGVTAGSLLVPALQLRRATKRKIIGLVRTAAQNAAHRSAKEISVKTIDRVIDRLSVEVSPRPLQRALNKMLE
jgi:hypothetical protein